MRRKLTDVFQQGNSPDWLDGDFRAVKPAFNRDPLPAGTYKARVVGGELSASLNNKTPSYKLTFEVAEGDHAGRRVWHDLWLTSKAAGVTAPLLAELGIHRRDQLDKPLPEGLTVAVRVALRKSDTGEEYNEVRSFKLLAVDPPKPEPFAPDEPSRGDAWEPPNDGPYGGDRP